MREIRTSGSMSGDGKRSHGVDCDTGTWRKPPATVKPHAYSHRARPRLYRRSLLRRETAGYAAGTRPSLLNALPECACVAPGYVPPARRRIFASRDVPFVH